MSKLAAAIFCAFYTVRGYPGRFLWADGAVRGVSYLTELQEYCEKGMQLLRAVGTAKDWERCSCQAGPLLCNISILCRSSGILQLWQSRTGLTMASSASTLAPILCAAHSKSSGSSLGSDLRMQGRSTHWQSWSRALHQYLQLSVSAYLSTEHSGRKA